MNFKVKRIRTTRKSFCVSVGETEEWPGRFVQAIQKHTYITAACIFIISIYFDICAKFRNVKGIDRDDTMVLLDIK